MAVIGTLVFVFGLVAGCGGEDVSGAKKAHLALVEWDCAIASTHVLATVLEDLGYDVEITSVDAGIMYQGLATGSFDAMTTAWLPHTHAAYMEEVGASVDDLGPNYDGDAKIGLVVPSYATIDSITEMNDDRFNGKIVGIEPGAGIMAATENAIDVYDLDLELQDSSSFAMAAALKSAIENEEWIAVTGWSPHWKFAVYDLKYLDDPEGVYGGAESINTIARLGLKEDDPALYSMLDNFIWAPEDIGTVMLMVTEGMDPYEAARQWVDENQDKVAEWTKDA